MKMIIEAARVNLLSIIINHYKDYDFLNLRKLISIMRDLKMSYWMIMKNLVSIKTNLKKIQNLEKAFVNDEKFNKQSV
jgi:hypothetical protein